MPKGVVIAGTSSGCGKTTVTIGILAALIKRGLKVQAFKTGPDFIDTGLHSMVTGRLSRNLDLWMCGEDYVSDCYTENSADADISVVEGVMGMYDGEYSTASLARHLGLPVILVVDAYGMAESAGAVVKGFVEWQENTDILGVIFNRAGSEKHYIRLKESLRNVNALGYIPRDVEFEIGERHLGLKVAEEGPISEEKLEKLADTVLRHVQIGEITEDTGKKLTAKDSASGSKGENLYAVPYTSANPEAILAVAYDKAFCFYYEDNMDLMEKAGIAAVKFSPLHDSSIPEDADAIYIGGGYPELYAGELSKNKSLLNSINKWAESGRPIYAECGGLMYLSQGIYDSAGIYHEMAGALPFETRMKERRSYLGYRTVLLKEDCMLGREGSRLRGHEFHYSEIIAEPATASGDDLCKVFSVYDRYECDVKEEGYLYKNTLASYIHLHFGSNAGAADNLKKFIRER